MNDPNIKVLYCQFPRLMASRIIIAIFFKSHLDVVQTPWGRFYDKTRCALTFQRYVELLALTIGKGGATFAQLSAFLIS